jgi:cytochrome c peroxidase
LPTPVALVAILSTACAPDSLGTPPLTPEDLQAWRLPSADDYAAIPQDEDNPLTTAKVELGRLLFHDPQLLAAPKAATGLFSAGCASCHHADAGFSAGVRQGVGEGGAGFGAAGEARRVDPRYAIEAVDVQPVRSPPVLNVAWFDNVLWNGQLGAKGLNVGTEALWTVNTPKAGNRLGFDGLETQAIVGQDVHRLDVEAAGLDDMPLYRALFVAAFPDDPHPVTQVNAGLAIAAYERTIVADRAPFQRWLRGENDAMSDQALRGMALFFGKAACVDCHANPGLGGMRFEAVGMGDLLGPIVHGANPEAKAHLGRAGFTDDTADLYRFKVPQLYNLTDQRFFGHGGTFTTLRDVVEYKNRAIPQKPETAEHLSEAFRPLGLTPDEVDDLTAFLRDGLYDPELARYAPSHMALPSGGCAPVNDAISRMELGCDATLDEGFELGGWRLTDQRTGDVRLTFPDHLRVPRYGTVIVSRHATRADFEAVWGVLGPEVIYVAAPGPSEAGMSMAGARFALVDAAGELLDGPTDPCAEGTRLGRVLQTRSTVLAAPTGWETAPLDAATPGVPSVMRMGAGVYLSEVVDTGDTRRMGYIELAYMP